MQKTRAHRWHLHSSHPLLLSSHNWENHQQSEEVSCSEPIMKQGWNSCAASFYNYPSSTSLTNNSFMKNKPCYTWNPSQKIGMPCLCFISSSERTVLEKATALDPFRCCCGCQNTICKRSQNVNWWHWWRGKSRICREKEVAPEGTKTKCKMISVTHPTL